MTDRPAPTDTDRRRGVAYGFAAYAIWGTFPLIFHQLQGVGALEVLMHRVTWSFVVVAGILIVRRDPEWIRILRRGGPERTRLVAAAVCISINWSVYVWAVAQERVVEAALGYYINPLLTVALGVVVLREGLTRAQVVALVLAVLSVAVLTVSYGQVPWISLVLACSFAGYSFLKKAVSTTALTSLAVETAVLLPFAVVGLVVLEAGGDAAFLHGSTGRDLLLVALGAITATPLLLFAASARRVPLVLLGLLQYLTPTLQLVAGVAVLGEALPPDRLAGFVLVWLALVVLGVDAGRRARSAQDRIPGIDGAVPVEPDVIG
jgi:chloramphenicol-sensitive protein RarD